MSALQVNAQSIITYDSSIIYKSFKLPGYPRWEKRIINYDHNAVNINSIHFIKKNKYWARLDSTVFGLGIYTWNGTDWVPPNNRTFKFSRGNYDVIIYEKFSFGAWTANRWDTIYYDASHIKQKEINFRAPQTQDIFFYNSQDQIIQHFNKTTAAAWQYNVYDSKELYTYYPDGKKGSRSYYTLLGDFKTYKYQSKDSVIYDALGRISIDNYYTETIFVNCGCIGWNNDTRDIYSYYPNSTQLAGISNQLRTGGNTWIPMRTDSYVYDAKKYAWSHTVYSDQYGYTVSTDSTFYDSQGRMVKDQYNDNTFFNNVLTPSSSIIQWFYRLAPYAPTKLLLSKSGSAITLNWKDNAYNEAHYVVERSALPNGPYSIIATLGKDTTHVTDTTFSIGQSYRYKVYAVNAEGASAAAYIDYIYSNIDAPVVQIKNISENAFDVSWPAVAHATFYQMDVATDIGFMNLVFGYSNQKITGRQATVTGLGSNQKYYVRVRASDGTSTSEFSNTEEVTISLQAPLALAANAVTSTGFTTNWRTNNGEFYVVDIATDSSFSKIVKSGATVNTNYPVTGLTTGVTYYIRVMGVANGANSLYSNIVKAVPSAVPNQAPVFGNMPSSQVVYLKNNTEQRSSQFTLSDADGDNLVLKVQSSDQTLVDDDLVVFNRQSDGVTYQMDFQNSNYKEGNVTITIIADDGRGGISEAEFLVTYAFVSVNSQAINFPAFTQAYRYGDSNITLTATGGASGNPVTFASSDNSVAQVVNGNQLKITGAGSVDIISSQIGNAQYSEAPDVKQTLTVNKATLNVTAVDASKVYGSVNPNFTFSYSGFVNGEDASVLIAQPTAQSTADNTTSVGTVPITVSGGASQNYDFVYNNGTLTITQAPQQITFGSIPDKNEGDNAFALSATSDSGLVVQYTTDSKNISITNGQVTILGAGRATITASQPGDNNHTSATSVTQSFCVIPTQPVIGYSTNESGHVILSSSEVDRNNVWFLDGVQIGNQSTIAVSTAGTYNVAVLVDDCISPLSIDQVIVITGIEPTSGEEIQLYPNPVEDKLRIKLGAGNDAIHIVIYNSTGQALEEFTTSESEIEIDVRKFISGMYIVTVKSSEAIKPIRFIKK